jgi:uncharacterized protein YjlB
MESFYGSESMDPINQEAEIITVNFKDDGTFPNNEELPLILYRHVINLGKNEPLIVEEIFLGNNWGGSWRNGIYPYHHYHSTAHEVLGVYSGRCKVQLGGPEGEVFDIEAGDVVLIPAGVVHKNLGSNRDFRVVGAYPEGQTWDMNYGKAGERPSADRNIARVKLPVMDPVFGDRGPVKDQWNP